MTSPHLKAVIFDVRGPPSGAFVLLCCPDNYRCMADGGVLRTQVGGVVCRSPLLAIAAYEEERGLPRNYINCAM